MEIEQLLDEILSEVKEEILSCGGLDENDCKETNETCNLKGKSK